MMTPSYSLDDAEARHREAPETFRIPDSGQRDNIKPGQLVKLIFLPRERDPVHDWVTSERMWVQVERRLDDGGYLGKLDNYPLVVDLEPGDPVQFQARHVIDVCDPRDVE